MPKIVVKEMVCVGCGMRIGATIPQAKRHGWRLWVGGARCKTCSEKLPNGEQSHAAPIPAPTPPRADVVVECDECHKPISGGALEYEDGVHPGLHWLFTDENKRRLREEKKPIPMCPGMKRPGRVVEQPTEAT